LHYLLAQFTVFRNVALPASRKRHGRNREQIDHYPINVMSQNRPDLSAI
jgi:hypothetical protein